MFALSLSLSLPFFLHTFNFFPVCLSLALLPSSYPKYNPTTNLLVTMLQVIEGVTDSVLRLRCRHCHCRRICWGLSSSPFHPLLLPWGGKGRRNMLEPILDLVLLCCCRYVDQSGVTNTTSSSPSSPSFVVGVWRWDVAASRKYDIPLVIVKNVDRYNNTNEIVFQVGLVTHNDNNEEPPSTTILLPPLGTSPVPPAAMSNQKGKVTIVMAVLALPCHDTATMTLLFVVLGLNGFFFFMVLMVVVVVAVVVVVIGFDWVLDGIVVVVGVVGLVL